MSEYLTGVIKFMERHKMDQHEVSVHDAILEADGTNYFLQMYRPIELLVGDDWIKGTIKEVRATNESNYYIIDIESMKLVLEIEQYSKVRLGLEYHSVI